MSVRLCSQTRRNPIRPNCCNAMKDKRVENNNEYSNEANEHMCGKCGDKQANIEIFGEEIAEDDEQGLGEQEEARKPMIRRAPREPTKQEIDDHDATHLPFRSWCPMCVAGKAKHWPHLKTAGG